MTEKPETGGGHSPALLVGCVLLLLLLVAAVAIPNLIEARKHGGESHQIGALKTISTAQALFREMDKDNDGVNDYATLTELGAADLVDEILATGTKQGTIFRVWPSPTSPQFEWMATATPVKPGETGDRYFCINQEGVVYYTTAAPFPYRPDCTIPQGAAPVGK